MRLLIYFLGSSACMSGGLLGAAAGMAVLGGSPWMVLWLAVLGAAGTARTFKLV